MYVDGVFSPKRCKLALTGLLGAQSLSKCTKGYIPVRLMNCLDKEITLNKDTKIGCFEVIDEINLGINVNVINNSANKEYLKEILKQIDNNSFLDKEQKLTAKEIFKRYSNVLS